MRYFRDYQVGGHLYYYLEAAEKLGLEVKPVIQPDIFKISNKEKSVYFNRAVTPLNISSSASLSRDKSVTSQILKKQDICVPEEILITKKNLYDAPIEGLTTPLVVKPLNQHGGQGVYLGIQSAKEARLMISKLLEKYPHGCLVQQQVFGEDYRIVVLNKKIIGFVHRQPPYVVGDGIQSIASLTKTLPSRFKIDGIVTANLAKNNLNLNSILDKGKRVQLRDNANGSTGGIATTLNPDSLHPDIAQLCIKATQLLGLTLAAVDLLVQDIAQPVVDNASLIEINSAPGTRLHMEPMFGEKQDICTPILNHIFNQ
jgi:cyanophycin synthetase